MKLVYFLVILLCFICITHANQGIFSESKLKDLFSSFSKKFKKIYSSSAFLKKFNIFKRNTELIANHNAKKSSYKLEVNEFADLTPEEFKATRTGGLPSEAVSSFIEQEQSYIPPVYKPLVTPLPKTVDYVKAGALNPVRDQGNCGSCWSFASVAVVEAGYYLKHKQLVELSEQQIIDCDIYRGNKICGPGGGGHGIGHAYRNGLCRRSDYPYKAKFEECYQDKCEKVAKPLSYRSIPRQNQTYFDAILAHVGPVTVSIQASSHHVQFYKSGILDDPTCPQKTDHLVVAVGYGVDEATGKEYWIIRNSWGPVWGENGYMRIAKGKNICGILTTGSDYPEFDDYHEK